MEDNQLKFQGFHPSEFTRSYLGEKIDAIKDWAPQGSNLKATFTRRDRLFKGVISVSSSAGKFFAIASGHKLKEVTHKLTQQIHKQMSRWKDKRAKKRFRKLDNAF